MAAGLGEALAAVGDTWGASRDDSGVAKAGDEQLAMLMTIALMAATRRA
jgi:hypothetical protein